MKISRAMVLAALLLLASPTFGAGEEILVVVNGNTETNREAYNYIRKEFRANSISRTITASMNPGSVKPGQYRTVVVLNTGTTGTLDPVLKKFIDGYSDKANLYLVNLYKGKREVTVTPFRATENQEGVDGVTASSAWKEGFGGSSAILDMHKEWFQALATFLGRP